MKSPSLRGSPQSDRGAALQCGSCREPVLVAAPGESIVTGAPVVGERRVEIPCNCGAMVRARVAPEVS